MLLIPELKTIVILNPRAASMALTASVQKRWPRAMLLYRHMEADGAPVGYERWRKIGVVRQPLDRLWSYYRLLRSITQGQRPLQTLWRSLQPPFASWLTDNRTPVFSTIAAMVRDPVLHMLHPGAENLKSQYAWLRPDLGTVVYRFEDQLGEVERLLDIELVKTNVSEVAPIPQLTAAALAHVDDVFAWDLAHYEDIPASVPYQSEVAVPA